MKDEMDILKEVGNTAAAHGSIALSEILGKKIKLHLPVVDIIPCKNIGKAMSQEGMSITLQTQLLSGLDGKVVFILEEKQAYKLIDICYTGGEIKKTGIFTEMGMSLIKEVGNVVIASYISALGFFLRKLIVPSLPILINAPLQEIIKLVVAGYGEHDYVLVVESIFEESETKIKGTFWLLLAPDSVKQIKEACKKLLEEVGKNDGGN
ncbi:MAG: chemotaxis protein CheC [Candidatus Omnitrophica bacterium]|nr:chemotaxis protein CheC [Candidatus Omnitrophota bacterium]